MEFIKKNWLVILCVLGLLALSGLWTGSGLRAKEHIADARDRIIELEGSLAKSEAHVGELEEIGTSLRQDSKSLEKRYSELKDAHNKLRGYYNEFEFGTDELEGSNKRSLELVRRGLEILAESEVSDSGD